MRSRLFLVLSVGPGPEPSSAAGFPVYVEQGVVISQGIETVMVELEASGLVPGVPPRIFWLEISVAPAAFFEVEEGGLAGFVGVGESFQPYLVADLWGEAWE